MAKGDSVHITRHKWPKASASSAQVIFGWIGVSLWASMHYISPLLLLSGFLFPIFFGISTFTIVWASVIALLCIYPHRPWPAARMIFRSWFELFDLESVIEGRVEDLDPSLRYIACWGPHGIIPMAGYIGFTWFQMMLPQLFGVSAVASILLRLPLFRQFLMWNGAISADGPSIRSALTSKNVSILPGGIAELMLSSREHEKLYIKQRAGIVRVAIEKGTPIVPCYMFGNTQFFDQLATGDSWPARMSRHLKMSFTLFYGRFFLPIPFPCKVVLVLAQPLPLPPGKTDADVQQYHQLWI